ncbi:radical SAM protein [Actinomadura sp. KC216]|uniref:radical SAM protein n=1 Tax=Actinomadura sp. KC216 TaxID=2530370 RepID=UPI001A9DA541
MMLGTAAYVALGERELARRVASARELLGPERCRVCPRACKVDRTGDEVGFCGIGRHAVVAAHYPHFGEERCLRGTGGSGAVFFSGCGMRCVFCQNHDVSWTVRGQRVEPPRLAAMMLELQERGCHNVNVFTPEHVVPQLLEGLLEGLRGGLALPLVYNSSSFDGMESLRLLDGVVDVYVPDLKVWTAASAREHLRTPDYREVALSAIREMHRQVGPLVLDDAGLARRGLLVRHLVMPGMIDETARVLRWIVEELGGGTYVNLMAQYTPMGLVSEERYADINRPPLRAEYEEAVRLARELGLNRLDERSRAWGRTLPLSVSS